MERLSTFNYARYIEKSSALLTAIGNANRIKILTILLEGEISVGQLSERTGISQSALSQHLARLRRASLVSRRRDVTTVFYWCDSDAVDQILCFLCAAFDVQDVETARPDQGSNPSRSVTLSPQPHPIV